MARKFLYLIVFLVVVVIGGLVALRFWAEDLTEFAFVPSAPFEAQAPLVANVYDDPAMWISRPGKGPSDPARWMPTGAAAPAAPGASAVRAAVFFIHPTSYLDKDRWNAPLDDKVSSGRAEIMVRGLASPFNSSEEVWAPRYRQAAFGSFLSDGPQARQALDLAYGDVLQAFDYFLETTDPKVPIVLAGHSQGAQHLMRLLRDRVAGKPLARRIAVAYVVGWPVSLTHDLPALELPPCTAPDQSGCVMSWLSFAEPADPAMMATAYARRPGLDGQPLAGSPMLCSNPLTGAAGGSAPASANLGTLVPDILLKTGKIVPGMVPASCGTDGFLAIGPAPNIGPFVLPGNNYHVYDIPLFWANLRTDFARRVAAWKP
ncbi:MAG TPA: DUF3089 domain-containing protein [Novosphingobium sp.]|nr:DUF3089 domain-containing protein [Novosphingobium sp.]